MDELHIRHCMLYEFRQGKKATNATEAINHVYPNALDVRKCQRWFAKFREGNYDLQDSARSGRPSDIDEEQLLLIVEEDPRQSLETIADRMGKTWSVVQRHMMSIGKVHKSGKWVPTDGS